MKKLNVIGMLFASVFGSGKNAIKVDEKETEATFTGEQVDAMAEAVERLDVANAEVSRLSAELVEAQGVAATERARAEAAELRVTELEAQVAELGTQAGSMGAAATKEKDDVDVVPVQSFETSFDREMRELEKQNKN